MDNIQLNPEQIQQMILMLQQMLPANTQQEKMVKSKKTKASSENENEKVNPIKTKKINMTNQRHENKFLEMSEMGMHKSDALIDKKLNKFPPTPRSRPFELVTVKCRVCGKTEDVHPKLVLDSVDRYKCNNCSTAEG
jgi:hypothetical protein